MKQFFEASNELLTIPIGIFKFQRAQMKMQFQKGCKLVRFFESPLKPLVTDRLSLSEKNARKPLN